MFVSPRLRMVWPRRLPRGIGRMAEINLLAKYPKSKRNLTARKSAQAESRLIARQFGREYFDGTREQGYGGYRYDGRWVPIARDMAKHFNLKSRDRVLDIGCPK